MAGYATAGSEGGLDYNQRPRILIEWYVGDHILKLQ